MCYPWGETIFTTVMRKAAGNFNTTVINTFTFSRHPEVIQEPQVLQISCQNTCRVTWDTIYMLCTYGELFPILNHIPGFSDSGTEEHVGRDGLCVSLLQLTTVTVILSSLSLSVKATVASSIFKYSQFTYIWSKLGVYFPINGRCLRGVQVQTPSLSGDISPPLVQPVIADSIP